MFVPSQKPFPLTPAPIEREYNQWCSICRDHFTSWNQCFAPKDVAPGSYALINGKVKMVCKGCHRYVGLDYNDPLIIKGKLDRLSKQEWQAYKQMLHQKLPKHIARHLYKSARKERYFQATTHSWEDFFPPMEAEWLQSQFDEITQDLDFVDNYRAANKAKSNHRRRYYKQQANGCCGSRDVERFCQQNGQYYLLGVNYGH
jgi:hypothetical protein